MNTRPAKSTDPEPARAGSIAVAVGPIVALLTAGLLARVRDSVGATNVALILAMIVVVAALAGRAAGFVTAITAAIVFNYFHTKPFHSLRIDGAKDVVTVFLLAFIGLVVSEIGAWRRRLRSSAATRLHGTRALETVAAMLAAGRPTTEIWTTVRQILIDELHLADCTFDPTNGPPIAELPRTGSLVATSMHLLPHGFALPTEGIKIALVSRGTGVGSIVLAADSRYGSSHESRALAIAIADLYAVALQLERTVSQSSPRGRTGS